jgi:thioredoxin-like negative regulator of GroEL
MPPSSPEKTMTLPLPTPSSPLAALDLRDALHRALRCRMFDTLVQVGRLDASDAGELQRAVRAVQQLLELVQEPASPLHELLDALRRGPAAQRQQAAQALYDALAAWTAATL